MQRESPPPGASSSWFQLAQRPWRCRKACLIPAVCAQGGSDSGAHTSPSHIWAARQSTRVESDREAGRGSAEGAESIADTQPPVVVGTSHSAVLKHGTSLCVAALEQRVEHSAVPTGRSQQRLFRPVQAAQRPHAETRRSAEPSTAPCGIDVPGEQCVPRCAEFAGSKAVRLPQSICSLLLLTFLPRCGLGRAGSSLVKHFIISQDALKHVQLVAHVSVSKRRAWTNT